MVGNSPKTKAPFRVGNNHNKTGKSLSPGQRSKRKRADTRSPTRHKRARKAESAVIEHIDEYDDQGLTDLDQDGIEYDSDEADELTVSVAGS